MRLPLHAVAASLVVFLAAGCADQGPTEPMSPDDLTPEFHHRPGHGGGPPGNGNGDDDEDPGNGDGSLATSWAFAERAGDAITGDGRAGGPYVDGECGVSSIINVEGGSDDALLRTSWRRIHPRDSGACGGRDARVFFVDLTDTVDGAPDRGVRQGTFGNVNRVGRVGPDDGSTLEFGAVFNLSGCNLRVGRIKDADENWPGTDDVRITPGTNAAGQTTWTVESTGGHVAMCVTDFGDGSPGSIEGDLYVVPFQITITDLERAPANPF